MTASPLAMAWAAAHLKRRRLPCNFVTEPTERVDVPLQTEQTERRAAALSTNCKPLSDEMLAALRHRSILRGQERQLVCSADDLTGSLERNNSGSGNASNDGGEDSHTQLQRSSPQRVASGVARFVEEQASRMDFVNGPAQACFLLHTALTACVRHAVRYGRLDSPHKSPPPTAAGLCRDGNVTASPHINFCWSARVAARHVAEVAQHTAVQKQLRSLLWKVVNKEHKRIVQSAVRLCTDEAAGAASLGVDEAEMRRFFGIPAEVVTTARESLGAVTVDVAPSSSSLLPRQQKVQEQQQQLALLGKHHFAFATTSAQLATSLTEEVKGMRQPVWKNDPAEAGPSSSVDVFVRQLGMLVVDMARVRMAVAILLQFEIVARRYAAFGKQQEQQKQEQKQQDRVALALAQELCTLAATAGSRSVERTLHRKRFLMYFCVHVQSPQRGVDAVDPIEAPHERLKDIFAAISCTASHTEAAAKVTTGPDGIHPSSPSAGSPHVAAAAAVSASSNAVTAVEGLEENDPLLQVVLSAAPKRKNPTPRAAPATAKKGTKATVAVGTKGAQLTPATWHFRCCSAPSVKQLDAVTAVPCSEDDAKVQVLRPSRLVPWPFTLEFDEADTNSSGESRKNNDCAPSQLNSQREPYTLLRPAALRMCYDSKWAATAGVTERDAQHAAQLQRLLTRRSGQLLLVNGCPCERLKSVMRMTQRDVRLVLRFR
ncbi:hypothetical protein DQ04_08181010 [Trypanosoma grayi]|uniref:hypothetical protein n=1 Tax=Trypanosoma grayi TaxID=71804 RepID=UPI0004F435D0|nr:hypothetical protein DQ04_08181010 [Trypanosoma grayi]KEG08031.1 hypothetical protein DQ04_08181010 [Trypanosoma grayi]